MILENNRGEVVGIEVKASKTVTAKDLRGLEFLEANLGKRFVRGIVLYTGQEPIHFRTNLSALPINAMWST
jgi:predicted AAA+ superfamily ATPase